MKLSTRVKSLLAVLVMALMFSAATPVVLPQTHTAEAAKKKSSKKKKSTKKSKKKASKAVNLKVNKTIVNLKVGKKITLKASGNQKKAVKWSTTAKCVTIKAKGTKVTVTGVKDGMTVVTAKVGKSKASTVIFVGRGTYASGSKKTKKAAGNPVALLASYIAKHPITVQTGNTNTSGSPKADVENEVYSLSVSGANLVVSYTSTWASQSSTDPDETASDSYVYTMSIPTDGNPVATVQRVYTGTYIDGSFEAYTYTASVNINTLTVATRVNGTMSSRAKDGTVQNGTFTGVRADDWYLHVSTLVNELHAFLVDNNIGYTAADLGFVSFHANHRGIGVLTSAELAEYGQQIAASRADYQAYYEKGSPEKYNWN